MNKVIQTKLKQLPSFPGVYLFKSVGEEILYVGKAKVLKNRVKSYFQNSHDLLPRTQQLVASIADLEYIICDNEVEALMLENNLIKKHQPRYNVLLRDDKNYQFIKIDYSTQIPQIYTVRKIETKNKKRAKYFGPYTSSRAIRATLSMMRYIIPYCANKKLGGRPCFYYHLGRCPGVCAGVISLQDYQTYFVEIERFLSGQLSKIARDLKLEMRRAAKTRLYEKAARLRDQILALNKMLEQQKIVSPNRESHDIVGEFLAGQLATVTLFQVREGKLIARENFILENAKDVSLEELLRSFLQRYYMEASDIPPQINTPMVIRDLQELKILLGAKIGKRVEIASPSRGQKRKLIKLAQANAQDFLRTQSQNSAKELAQLTKALFELKDKLKLPTIPLRIECFDISNIQGTLPTGSMVVFENGKAKKRDYKRFAIRSIETPNDFAMMEEMLNRRLSHRDSQGHTQTAMTNYQTKPNSKFDKSWQLPDLIVIDGGRGQLNVARKVLQKHHLKIAVLGLAKKLEEIYLPQFKLPLRLPANSAALHLLQRLRDEAHRFAITYHRQRRSKALLET